jgi:hypothetical protein
LSPLHHQLLFSSLNTEVIITIFNYFKGVIILGPLAAAGVGYFLLNYTLDFLLMVQ